MPMWTAPRQPRNTGGDYELEFGQNLGPVRFAELRKRGVGKDLAAQTAGSAHGPWRLANSPALQVALPNAYFDSLGIPRLTVVR